jgi:putative transposase
MLTKNEFANWNQGLRLPRDTVEIIDKIRKCPPSRRVGGGSQNMSGSYPSRKMGRMIQFESHTVELPLVYFLEHDPNVLEYFCQPAPIELRYLGPTGKNVVAVHTPDYFVIWKDRAGWVEAKSADKLPRAAERSPNRYQQVGDHWECPPGKAYAEALGLCYVLHSSAEIHPTFVRNAVFLDDHRRNNAPVPPASMEEVKICIEQHPSITLQMLLDLTKDIVEEDCIYQMIATCLIWVDLNAVPLINPDRVHVFADPETMVAFHASADFDHIRTTEVRIEPGGLVTWDGSSLRIANVGDHTVSLLAANETIVEVPEAQFYSLLSEGRLRAQNDDASVVEHPAVASFLATAHPSEMKLANQRAAQVQAWLRGESDRPSNIPLRTWQKRVADYRKAQDLYGYGYIGVFPKTKKRGNRGPKLPENVRLTMDKHIKEDFENLVQGKMYESYVKLQKKLEAMNLPCPSYVTFTKVVGGRPKRAQKLARQGSRAAYKFEEFYFSLDQETPRHGERPFEIAHIDHTELDLEMLDSGDGENLGRLWLTIMTDAFSRRFLAYYLSFDPPSYRSCMMVIRECVRRHGRLPQTIVVDGGKEFASKYFDSLLAFYEITKKVRPPAKSRFGSTCERLFGVTNTQFIHTLRGNTQIMKNVRQVTKSNDPKRAAIWDILLLDNRARDYLYEVRDTMYHRTLGQTPREAFVSGEHLGGRRQNRRIVYDTTFLMSTAPTTPKGTAKVIPGQGVTINYFNYWSAMFRDPAVEETQVHVRYDPFDLGIAWAFVNGRWVECTSQYYSILHGRSERELMIASRKLREQMRMSSRKRFTATARQLADFLSRVAEDEELLLQHRKDSPHSI